MSALEFLTKKGWHPSTLKNAEKVWIAEQKTAAEQKKLEEFQKQLAEERQLSELKALQRASGNSKTVGSRLDWMYEGPASAASSGPSAEEYLLGKAFEDTKHKDEVMMTDSKEVIGATFLPTSAPTLRVTQFTIKNEDPMFAIRASEQAARARLLDNPVHLAKLRAQLVASRAESKKSEEKKERHKHRKHGHHHHRSREKRHRRGSGSESSSDCRLESKAGGRGGTGTAAAAPPVVLVRATRPASPRRRSSSPARPRDSDLAAARGPAAAPRGDRLDTGAASRRSRSRSAGRRRRSRSAGRGGGGATGGAAGGSARPVSGAAGGSGAARRGDDDEDEGRGMKQYGLVVPAGAVQRASSGTVGPSADMQTKRTATLAAEKARADEARRANVGRGPLTAEEKTAKLAQMASDATVHEEERWARLKHGTRIDHHDDSKDGVEGNKAPTFIKDMKHTFVDGAHSMEQRILTKRHYSQRGPGVEGGMS